MVNFILLLSALTFGAIAFALAISSLSLTIIYDEEDTSIIRNTFICILIAIILGVMGLAI